jgi:hypothetical protein
MQMPSLVVYEARNVKSVEHGFSAISSPIF